MARRVRLFSLGALIGVFGIYLSTYLPGENSVSKTLNGYIDYFSPSKRVIWHLNEGFAEDTSFSNKSICQMIYYGLKEKDVLEVLNEGKVNFSLSDKDNNPYQLFVVENIVQENPIAVQFSFYADEQKAEVVSLWYVGKEEQCIR